MKLLCMVSLAVELFSGSIRAEDFSSVLRKGDLCFQKQDYACALDRWKKASDLKPDDEQALSKTVRELIDFAQTYLRQGRNSLAKKKSEEALKWAERYNEKFPEDPQALTYLAIAKGGMALFNTGIRSKIKTAWEVEALLKKALDLRPRFNQAEVALGALYFEISRLNFFERFFVSLFGGLPKAQLHDAEKLFLSAYNSDPSFNFACYELGRTYLRIKQKEKASFFFEKVQTSPQIFWIDSELKKEAETQDFFDYPNSIQSE